MLRNQSHLFYMVASCLFVMLSAGHDRGVNCAPPSKDNHQAIAKLVNSNQWSKLEQSLDNATQTSEVNFTVSEKTDWTTLHSSTNATMSRKMMFRAFLQNMVMNMILLYCCVCCCIDCFCKDCLDQSPNDRYTDMELGDRAAGQSGGALGASKAARGRKVSAATSTPGNSSLKTTRPLPGPGSKGGFQKGRPKLTRSRNAAANLPASSLASSR